MYASPVAYPVSLVPENGVGYSASTRMAGVIEGFRWSLLGNQSPDFYVMAISATVVMALLAAGIVYFKEMERTFADEV